MVKLCPWVESVNLSYPNPNLILKPGCFVIKTCNLLHTSIDPKDNCNNKNSEISLILVDLVEISETSNYISKKFTHDYFSGILIFYTDF